MSTPTPDIDPPECPVCLNPYDTATTVPRVIPCGHSVCQDCLCLLPHPFPSTIRCPACTHLVKLTSPKSLPKNIDLLRYSDEYPCRKNVEKLIKIESLPCPDDRKIESTTKNGGLTQDLLEKPKKIKSLSSGDWKSEKATRNGDLASLDCQFVPNLWNQEFFLKWRKWVVAESDLALEMSSGDGLFSVLHGRCLMEGRTGKVSLVRIGCFDFCAGVSMRYSYVSKVMWVLHRMKDEERDEIWSILSVSSLRRVSKVYGMWYNGDDQGVYMVCERFVNNFSEDIDKWKSILVGKCSDELLRFLSFAMIAMEICEAISALHSEGVSFGCVSIGCFCFDEFGHVYLNLNESLVSARRIGRLVKEATKNKDNVTEPDTSLGSDILESLAFVSPEIFFELLKKNGVDTEFGVKFDMGHGSDVWSLACVLLTLLCGEDFLKLTTIEGSDYIGFYRGLRSKIRNSLDEAFGNDIESLKEILCNCFSLDPGDRPVVIDVWKCMRELFIKPQFDIVVNTPRVDKKEENNRVCLFWGELCRLGETSKSSEKKLTNCLQDEGENGKDDDVGVRENSDLFEGVSEGHIKCIALKSHFDCVTGLAVGGGFLFSSSYDKTVQVWSLQDFNHVHTFKGHEHKVMALVFVDKEQPLCISGDSGGGIFIWDASFPLGQEPIKKLQEQKDWRYSGIHCLAVSGTEYLYTGSGDKSIKAWSLQDYTLSSVMNGHNSVVSTLAVSGGVLYSGSWDGTVRLWCLSDHSPLAVLEEGGPGKVVSVLSLAAYEEVLVVAHGNGSIKIWRNNALSKSIQVHEGAIFSVGMSGKWLFTGGWDKAVNVQELLDDDFQVDSSPIGSITCDAVITSLFYWQGKLFVGQADRIIKVYHYGS